MLKNNGRHYSHSQDYLIFQSHLILARPENQYSFHLTHDRWLMKIYVFHAFDSSNVRHFESKHASVLSQSSYLKYSQDRLVVKDSHYQPLIHAYIHRQHQLHIMFQNKIPSKLDALQYRNSPLHPLYDDPLRLHPYPVL